VIVLLLAGVVPDAGLFDRARAAAEALEVVGAGVVDDVVGLGVGVVGVGVGVGVCVTVCDGVGVGVGV
jgi:hypothetical protein